MSRFARPTCVIAESRKSVCPFDLSEVRLPSRKECGAGFFGSRSNIAWAEKALERARRTVTRARLMIGRDRRGASAVEFAMVMPVFIAIVVATIELSRALETWNDMNHAVSQAVRIVNIDAKKTTGEVASTLEGMLADYAEKGLSVSVTSTAVAGISHIRISATLPFHVNIPFAKLPAFILEVDTLAPLMSP